MHQKHGYENKRLRELIIQLCIENQDLADNLIKIYQIFKPDPNINIVGIVGKLKKINDKRDEFAHNKSISTDTIEQDIDFFKKNFAITPSLKIGIDIMECLIKFESS